MSAPKRLQLLKELDPQALRIENKKEAKQALVHSIHPNDHYRIQRALEIILASNGKKWSTFWKEARSQTMSSKFCFFGFWFNPRPLDHKQALLERAQKMVDAGIVEEVGQVYKEYGSVPALRTLGCKEALEVYLGQASQKNLAESLAQAHRKYAKKQRIWLQKESALEPILPRDFMQKWGNLMKRLEWE